MKPVSQPVVPPRVGQTKARWEEQEGALTRKAEDGVGLRVNAASVEGERRRGDEGEDEEDQKCHVGCLSSGQAGLL